MRHATYCSVRLGDNLAHLHFIRKVAEAYPGEEFCHYAHEQYLPELWPVIRDMPQVQLKGLGPFVRAPGSYWMSAPDEPAINAWKNAEGFWQGHRDRLNYSAFMLQWFGYLAGKMGFVSPLKTAADLLFDYPALRASDPSMKFDFLVINSRPMSGQARGYDHEAMARLVLDLSKKHRVVTTSKVSEDIPSTEENGYDVTKIGRLSQVCRYILMVSTGPSWPTFNVWNRDSVKVRIVINEPETLNLDPKEITVSEVEQVRLALCAENLL